MNKMSPRSDVSTALSYVDYESLLVDVSLVPLGIKATHDPTGTVDDLWGEAEVPRANEDSEASEYRKVYEITL